MLFSDAGVKNPDWVSQQNINSSEHQDGLLRQRSKYTTMYPLEIVFKVFLKSFLSQDNTFIRGVNFQLEFLCYSVADVAISTKGVK